MDLNIGELLDPSYIRSEQMTFQSILLRQIDRKNQVSVLAYQGDFKTGVLRIYQSLSDMEALMWDRIKDNPSFQEEKAKLRLNFDELHKASQIPINLMQRLEQWYKLLSKFFKYYGIISPVRKPMDFRRLDQLSEEEREAEKNGKK